MSVKGKVITAVLSVLLLCVSGVMSYAQTNDRQSRREKRNTPPPVQPKEVRRYKVEGGILIDTGAERKAVDDSLKRDTTALLMLSDSLLRQSDEMKSEAEKIVLRADSLVSADINQALATDSMRRSAVSMTAAADSLQTEGNRLRALLPGVGGLMADARTANDTIPEEDLSRREQRQLQRQREDADSTFVRYSPIFRDTLPISRMTAISLAVPGFSQLHNKQYWKIPVAYAALGTTIYMGVQNNKCYSKAKSHYNELVYYGYTREDSDMDETQRVMIKYNTRRQLWFGAALATYIYVLGDGVMNYPGSNTNVKIATTLSTICPGAGQIYNGSYWKAPIVMGAFATMVMTIDWNNRGYERFKLAYNLKAEGRDESIEASLRSQTAEQLKTYRQSYRRNRDLCIILTGLVYIINIVDAHVDAHMKNYDVSNDLNITVTPSMSTINTRRNGNASAMGLSFNLNF